MEDSEYIHHHLDAITDIDMAHSMALASNERRTNAALFRAVAKIYDEVGSLDRQHVTESYRNIQHDMLNAVLLKMRDGDYDETTAFERISAIFSSSSLTADKSYELQAAHIALANIHFHQTQPDSLPAREQVVRKMRMNAERYDQAAEGQEADYKGSV